MRRQEGRGVTVDYIERFFLAPRGGFCRFEGLGFRVEETGGGC